MSFADQLKSFGHVVGKRSEAVFVGTVVEMERSIKFGSAITGAPAMPVAPGQFARAGALRDSVTVSYLDPNTALIYTTLRYAEDVEWNAKGHTFVSGGPYGWSMTTAAFARVVEAVAKRQGDAEPVVVRYGSGQ